MNCLGKKEQQKCKDNQMQEVFQETCYEFYFMSKPEKHKAAMHTALGYL